MKFFLYLYVLFSIVAAASAWLYSGWQVGVAAIAAAVLSIWSGIGLRASITTGNRLGIVIAAIISVLFLAISQWLMLEVAYEIKIFGISVGGGAWSCLGWVLGFLATSRKDCSPSDTDLSSS
jgi:hypothetical protein